MHLTGPADYELRVRCADTRHLDRLLGALENDHRIAATHTRVVLDRVVGADDVRAAALDVDPGREQPA